MRILENFGPNKINWQNFINDFYENALCIATLMLPELKSFFNIEVLLF